MLNTSIFSKLSDAEKGIGLMLFGALVIPCMDAIAKHLGGSLSPGFIAFARFFFQSIIMLCVLIALGRFERSNHLMLNFFRSALILSATIAFFAAVQVLPMAEAIAIFFVSPMILTLISVMFLGETIGWRRVAAILVGFLGAMLIIKPSYEVFGARALLPLISAVTFACYLAISRSVAQKEHPLVMQFWTGVGGAVLSVIFLAVGSFFEAPVFVVSMPTQTQWLFLIAIGFFASLGHFAIVYSVRLANASTVAPFQYMEIISATMLGLIFFDDFPDAISMFGIMIIIGSGLYLLHRERITSKQKNALGSGP